MTPSEQGAIDEAKDVLKLHFDSFIITVRASTEDGGDRVISQWYGALSDVVGMNHITQLRVDRLALDLMQPPEVG